MRGSSVLVRSQFGTGRGIMLCDRAVTLAFDAVPDGGTIMRDGARALCA
jgi:hypothetical protein